MRTRAPLLATFFCALAAVTLVFAAPARANGRFPAANQLVVSKTSPSQMVLRTTFGILVSKDGGATWDWICEKAVGYGGTEDPSMGITAAGTLLAGTFEGLVTSADKGCAWTFVPSPLKQNVVVDLVVRPDAPASALVLTNKFKMAANDDAGTALFQSDIFASTDDGKTWSVLAPSLDPTILFETLEVAASDPQRLYLSGKRGSGTTESGVVLVSTDRGASWQEHPVPLLAAIESAPFISAVDPKNADRVYVRTKAAGGGGSRLLVSDDGGTTFRAVLSFKGDMLGFALSEDGQKVYVGGPKDGLKTASAAALTFAQTSTIAVQCLTASGGTLYACSNEVSGFILGASRDDGATFTPVLHLYGVRGPLACADGTSQAQCVADWPPLRDSLGSGPTDAGSDAADGGAGGGGGASKGCTCDSAALGHGDGATALGAAAAILALTLTRRRAGARARR